MTVEEANKIYLRQVSDQKQNAHPIFADYLVWTDTEDEANQY